MKPTFLVQGFVLAFAILIIFTSCKPKMENEFSVTSSGMRYKIISQENSLRVDQNQWIKMQVKQSYGDTVLLDTHKDIPQYQKYDSVSMSHDAYKIFGQVREGDSLIFEAKADTVLQRKFPLPTKSNQSLITCVKIEKFFWNRDSVAADHDRELDAKKHRSKTGFQLH